jgi:MFS family permease
VRRVVGVIGARADSPFSDGAFRTLWFSNFATNTGVLIQTVGASWVMVEAGARPQLVALVQTATSLPLVLISPLAGALAEGMDRRQVMVLAQGMLAVVSAALALLAANDLATPWTVLACIFLVGCCMAFIGPAWQASVGDVLPRPAIAGAVIYNAVGLNLARSIGPAIGGVIVSAAGAATSFVVNAVTSLGLILVLCRWRPSVKKASPRSASLGAAIMEGLLYAVADAPIRAALLRALLFGTVAYAVQALLPLIARDVLHAGSPEFGALYGAFGLGALGGALLSTQLRQRFSPETVAKLCTAISAVATVGAAWSPLLWLTIACLSLVGGAWVTAFSTFNVAIQLASPRWIVARLLSLYQMSVFTGVALGSYFGGLMADHVGTSGSLSIMAALSIVSLLAGCFTPLQAEARLPSDALAAAKRFHSDK